MTEHTTPGPGRLAADNTRALATYICPDSFTGAGYAWLVAILEAMPEHNSEHVDVLEPERQRALMHPWAVGEEPLGLVVARLSPRRGALALRPATVIDPHRKVVFFNAPSGTTNWAVRRALRQAAAAAGAARLGPHVVVGPWTIA